MNGNEESLVHKESLVLLVGISFSYFTKSFVLFWLFAFSGAGPAAYGDSPARGRIGAVATATATPDPSSVCNSHHSSQQCRILDPLREARDQTRNLMVPSRIP